MDVQGPFDINGEDDEHNFPLLNTDHFSVALDCTNFYFT